MLLSIPDDKIANFDNSLDKVLNSDRTGMRRSAKKPLRSAAEKLSARCYEIATDSVSSAERGFFRFEIV